MATAVKDGIFTLTGEATIGDLVLIGETLSREGKNPTLRFVRSYHGDIAGATVDVEPARFEITGAGRDALHEETPDPADAARDKFDTRLRALRDDVRWNTVDDDTPVLWEGDWRRWSDLSQNERTCCHFDNEGQLVGQFPFSSDD